VGLFDLRKKEKSGPIGMGAAESSPKEPGGGGPSLFMGDLAALRWAAQQEAVNVGRASLEPERWEGGRMAFAYERQLAHDHEGIRDRLADYVAAGTREGVSRLHKIAGAVARTGDNLREADRRLAMVLHSWDRSYRDVQDDELELGRYFRLKSVPYQVSKWVIAALIFCAELAISVALFDVVMSQDIPAMPVLFAMGLILILMVVPHYSAIGVKEGVVRYHEAELDAFEKSDQHTPAKVRRKARIEEVEDRGTKLAAGIVGLVLVLLFIPLASLRAKELGTAREGTFWFFFFLLVQFAISGYFFLREWWDYGSASANLKHQDGARTEAIRVRVNAFNSYTGAVSAYMAASQRLMFLYRQAPRWDSYIIQSYLATVHYFRHLVILQNPDLDVFITLATVPRLTTVGDHTFAGIGEEYDPVSREHPELHARDDALSRGWWLKEVNAALVDSVGAHGQGSVESLAREAEAEQWRNGSAFESPERMLAEHLERYFGLTYPYQRPAELDKIEKGDPYVDPHPAGDKRRRPSGPSVEPGPLIDANGAVLPLSLGKRRAVAEENGRG
jgi:hypothetical protein